MARVERRSVVEVAVLEVALICSGVIGAANLHFRRSLWDFQLLVKGCSRSWRRVSRSLVTRIRAGLVSNTPMIRSMTPVGFIP
jgi:hypothetical protein